jgi:hypothetical protein
MTTTAARFTPTLPCDYCGPEAFYLVTAALALPTCTVTISAIYHSSSPDAAQEAFQARNRSAIVQSVKECPAP